VSTIAFEIVKPKESVELFDEIFISLFKWYENFGMIVASILIPESDHYNRGTTLDCERRRSPGSGWSLALVWGVSPEGQK
jgi:hypothetical protein